MNTHLSFASPLHPSPSASDSAVVDLGAFFARAEHEAETETLTALIRNGDHVQLERFRPAYPADAARLCLEMAGQHPEAVAVLLSNTQVAANALHMVGRSMDEAIFSELPPNISGLLKEKLATHLDIALNEGDAEAIEALIPAVTVASATLSSEQLRDILLKRNGDGCPGFYMALRAGHTEAIGAFGRLLGVIQDRLTRDDLSAILLAQKESGTSGLCIAMNQGEAGAVKAFGEVLVSFKDDLPPEDLQRILLAKGFPNEEGWRTTGLHRAMASVKPESKAVEVMRAYRALLTPFKNDLPREFLRDLLLPKGMGAIGLVTSLGCAVAWRRPAVIKEFGETLAFFGGQLKSRDIHEILRAEFHDGSVLLHAISHPDDDHRRNEIEAWGQMLLLLRHRLSHGDLLDLLKACDQQGVPGLNRVLASKMCVAVRTYGKLLARFELPSHDLFNILMARHPRTGVPGMLTASDKGVADVIRAFGEVLASLKGQLLPEQLLEIVFAETPVLKKGARCASPRLTANQLAELNRQEEEIRGVRNTANYVLAFSSLSVAYERGDTDVLAALDELVQGIHDRLYPTQLQYIEVVRKKLREASKQDKGG